MRELRKRALPALMVVMLVMTMTACDNTVKKAAERLSEIADTLGEVQSVTIDAYDGALISQEAHDQILRATLRANEAGKAATAVLAGLEESGIKDLDLDTKQKLLKYSVVISDSLDPENLSAIANIQDPDVRNKIKTALATARAILVTLDALLAF